MKKNATPERMIYTVKEVSQLLHTNPAFIYKLISTGMLPALKLGSLRIRKETLEQFLRQYEGYDLSDLANIRRIAEAS